jgi:hypothetical protein
MPEESPGRSCTDTLGRPAVQAEGISSSIGTYCFNLELWLFEQFDTRFALDATAFHSVPQVASAEECPGAFHSVEMMNDQDIVRIIDHTVYRFLDDPAVFLHVAYGVISFAPGVVVGDSVKDMGNRHGASPLKRAALFVGSGAWWNGTFAVTAHAQLSAAARDWTVTGCVTPA